MKGKKAEKTASSNLIRIPLEGRKKMLIERSGDGRKILRASVGKTGLQPKGPFKLEDLKITVKGKTVYHISPDATLAMRSAVTGQTCVLVRIGNNYYWICDPPTPPC
jgi:hypothetical protein